MCVCAHAHVLSRFCLLCSFLSPSSPYFPGCLLCCLVACFTGLTNADCLTGRETLDLCYDRKRFRIPIPCLLFGRRRPHRLAHPSRTPPLPSSVSRKALPATETVPLFPLVLWLDRGPHITGVRRKRFESPRRRNPPVSTLRRIWLRRITPPDPYQDPYIVAALIALAQAQWDWQSTEWRRRHPLTSLEPCLETSMVFTVSRHLWQNLPVLQQK